MVCTNLYAVCCLNEDKKINKNLTLVYEIYYLYNGDMKYANILGKNK